MKITLKILVFVIILTFTFQLAKDDCGTPVECYAKAIDLLNTDRKEMSKLKDIIEDELDKKVSAIEAELNKKFEEKVKELSDKQIKIEEELNNKTKEFEKVVADLKSQVLEYQKYLIKSNNIFIDDSPIIYHDIIKALETNVIVKLGAPVGWDENSYRTNLWNGRKMLSIGKGPQSNGNGITTKVPDGYDLLWLRCSNHVWGVFRFTYVDGENEEIGKFACGYRSLNNISPDGGVPDSFSGIHIWMSVPVGRSGNVRIQSDVNNDTWISGLAFGKNTWNLATNSAISYVWNLNGGNPIGYENWNNDQLGKIDPNKLTKIMVPVISNGKDKLLYFVEHNNNWEGTYHNSIKVNDVYVQRFRASYNNSFAVHFNSKIYQRYIATLVPKELIPAKAKFIEVEFDMTLQNSVINFREMGTHDLN